MATLCLEGNVRPVHYFGLLPTEHEATTVHIRSLVYTAWDNDQNLSPPKTRLRSEEQSERDHPPLEMLAWTSGGPVFPQALLDRFPQGTDEHLKLQQLKTEFQTKFGGQQETRPRESGSAGAGGGRAGGFCDFSIDNGMQPLDTTRTIELPHVAAADFAPASRLVRIGPTVEHIFKRYE